MGKQDVQAALQAMDDDAVRSQLAAGDLAPLGGTELTDEEQAMVIAAADDFPEVAGFSFKEHVAKWNIEQGSAWNIEQGSAWNIEQEPMLKDAGGGYRRAVKYSFVKV